MKLSELIASLESWRAEYGDVDVITYKVHPGGVTPWVVGTSMHVPTKGLPFLELFPCKPYTENH